MIEKAAIVLAAFGTSRRGSLPFALLQEQAAERYPDLPLYWGYTSEIICRKTGEPTLAETLAEVAAAGHRRAAILPVQIFPGGEYRRVCETAAAHSSVELTVGETLLHHPGMFSEILAVVEDDFLPAGAGINLLALHGTAAPGDPVHLLIREMAELIERRYHNVRAASLEGVPDHRTVLAEIARIPLPGSARVRIIPMTYVAGMHVEEDLMGDGASWRKRLAACGLEVECLTVDVGGERHYKSLAFYPGIRTQLLARLEAALQQLTQS